MLKNLTLAWVRFFCLILNSSTYFYSLPIPVSDKQIHILPQTFTPSLYVLCLCLMYICLCLMLYVLCQVFQVLCLSLPRMAVPSIFLQTNTQLSFALVCSRCPIFHALPHQPHSEYPIKDINRFEISNVANKLLFQVNFSSLKQWHVTNKRCEEV